MNTDVNTPGQILVVQKFDIIKHVMKHLLERNGYSVDFASSCMEAEKLVKAADYKLILMDVKVLDMSGVEATEKILAIKPNSVIAALTAMPRKDYYDDCMAAGMVDYFDLPLYDTELIKPYMKD
jgi:two-component system, sensor histidine kinase and response regulator